MFELKQLRSWSPGSNYYKLWKIYICWRTFNKNPIEKTLVSILQSRNVASLTAPCRIVLLSYVVAMQVKLISGLSISRALGLTSEFFIQSSYSQGFIWNGIVAFDKNFTDLTNINTFFFNSALLIGLKMQIEISSNSFFLYNSEFNFSCLEYRHNLPSPWDE